MTESKSYHMTPEEFRKQGRAMVELKPILHPIHKIKIPLQHKKPDTKKTTCTAVEKNSCKIQILKQDKTHTH